MARGGGELCAGFLRNTLAWTVPHCRDEGILQRLFGQLKIAQPTDEGGDELAILRRPLNRLIEILAFDQVIAAQLLFGLREWAVRDDFMIS